MKKLLLSITVLVVTFGIGRAFHCTQPVTQLVFRQNFNHIMAMRSDQHRLENARSFVAANCLLSRQVKQIAMLFHDDRTRIEFAKAAYATTYDKRNFYDVYDAFTYFSNAFRLHDFVLAKRAKRQELSNISRPLATTHEFPAYDYPNILNYNEDQYCDYPVGDKHFYTLVGRIIRERNDVDRIKVASRYAEANCLTVAQVMKIGSMIETDRNRFIFLKTVFGNVYDVMHYGYCDQLFRSEEYHEKFSLFLSGGERAPITDPQPSPCGISPAQFEEIKQHIAAQTFNSTRLSVGKQIIRAKGCFTARQVAELVLLFAFEEGRLEIAKFAYDYCVDPGNYFLVNNSFTFDASVQDLTEYVASRQ
jgi:hypothetical protein